MSFVETTTAPTLRPLWLPDLALDIASSDRWLWHGYVARRALTLLTSQWKAGKTTLLSVLLTRLGSGGELAGLPVAAGRAVIVSEESPELWRQRADHLDFGQHVCWLCRPFTRKPNVAQWEMLIDGLDRLRTQHGLTLAVIDTLASFLPGRDENTAAAILQALLPLRRLTEAGMAVLLLHHPRKQGAQDGLQSRGSGALCAHVDVLIEMNRCGGGPEDRRRRLRAFSRFSETPAERVIELNAAGTDYASLGDLEAEAFGRGWRSLLLVLATAPMKMSRARILEAWPPDLEPPSAATLWRWLERGVTEGRLRRDGAGTCSAPYCYWLPEREVEWAKDPLWLLSQTGLDNWRLM